MSKYSKLSNWIDESFSKKTAMEIHRRYFKWSKNSVIWKKQTERPKLKVGFYILGLKMDKKFKELARYLKNEEQVMEHRKQIKSGESQSLVLT